MSKSTIARKLAVTTLAATLLAGAGTGAAFAAETQAPEKSTSLQSVNLNLSNGQNIDNINLLGTYGDGSAAKILRVLGNGINLKTVSFSGGVNEMTFEGYGTLVNHFDANGDYTGTSYLDDPNVDASGLKTLSVPFGVTSQITYHNGGAFSSRVMANLNITLDDMATPVAEAPGVGAAAAAGPALPEVPETEVPVDETETVEVVETPAAPVVEVVETETPVAVTEETVTATPVENTATTPSITVSGGSGSNLTAEAEKETVREPLANTAVTNTSNNMLTAFVAFMIAGTVIVAAKLGFKSKTDSIN